VRAIVKLVLLPLGAIATACQGGGDERTTGELSDELSKDLQLASAVSVELAADAQRFERARVVSAVEAIPAGTRRTATSKAPKPKRAAPTRRVPKPAPPPEPAAEPAAEIEPAATAVEVADASPPAEPAPEPATEGVEQAPADQPAEGAGDEPSAEPRPAPRPRPIPVSYPGPERYPDGGGGIGTVIGGVIGVVIRGGGVGIDHCDERDIAIRRGGIARGVPIMRPTFPQPFPRY
jgi:hypothetical protein